MKKKRNKETKNNLQFYAKYSGLAFEMLGIIFLGTFGGVKLDAYLHLQTPVFTILFSLLSVFLALYLVFKDFLRK